MKRFARVAVAAVFGVAFLAALAAPVAARQADGAGWWWIARSTSLPQQPPAPPSVPPGGLYVSAGPAGATAVSALRFVLPDGTRATTLTLSVVDKQGTPSVGACVAKQPWHSADGGTWEDRPSDLDCSSMAPATVSADGSVLSVNVAGLARAGVVDVVLVPAVDAATQQNVPFTLSLAPPGDALAVEAAAGQPSSPALVAPTGAASAPATSTGAAAPAPSSFPAVASSASDSVASPAVAQTAQPAQPAAAAQADSAPSSPQVPAPGVLMPAAAASGPDTTARGRGAAIVLLGLAGAVWYAVGRGRWLGGSTGAGGVGRFARARDGSPPPV